MEQLRTMMAEDEGFNYDFNWHPGIAQNQTAGDELEAFKRSIKLVQGARASTSSPRIDSTDHSTLRGSAPAIRSWGKEMNSAWRSALLGMLAATLGACDTRDSANDGELKVRPVFADDDATLEEKRRILDQTLLDALIEAGTNVDLPHDIDHHFSSKDRKVLEDLAHKGRALGYKPGAISQSGERLMMNLGKSLKPKIEDLTRDSTEMARLAIALKCEYDGWGCHVQKTEFE